MTLRPATNRIALAALLLASACASAQAQVFTEDFGTLASPSDRATNTYVTGFAFRPTGEVSNGGYAVMRPSAINPAAGAYWANLATDHTANTNGALMVLNAGRPLNDIYRRDFTIEAGKSYHISAWRYVVNGASGGGSSTPLSWSLEVRNADSNTALASSGALPSSGRLQWEESTFDFTVPAGCMGGSSTVPARLAITNRTAEDNGNDLYVDDISVTEIPPVRGQPEFCPSGVGPEPSAVPTLDFAGLSLLGLLGAGIGGLALRRRQRGK